MNWISVKDRLPRIGQWCWVYGVVSAEWNEGTIYKDSDMSLSICQYNSEGKFLHSIDSCGDYDVYAHKVRYWIPIDKPEMPEDTRVRPNPDAYWAEMPELPQD